MLVLTSNITIGKYRSIKPADVKVCKSMLSFVDTAVLKLPISARIKNTDGGTESKETAKAFSEGDKVVINLGYDGKLKNEFTGFVCRVNFTSPVEIECEGYSWLLRQNTYLKAFKKTTLKEVLQFLVADTEIKLDAAIPEMPIDKWVMNQENGVEILEKLKKELLLTIFFTGNVLYAGLRYLKHKADVKYRLGYNVIKDNNLKLRQAKNREVVVVFVGEKKDGTKITVQKGGHTRKVDKVIKTTGSAGGAGETVTFKSHTVTDQKALEEMAEKKHQQLTYDGYEGKITAFLVPYCEPGYRAILEDPKYPERSGKYIIVSIEVQYGRNGGRRIVEIGLKL